MPFVLLYLVVEIVALVALGSAIGVGATLLVLLAGSVIGLLLARREGIRAAQAIAQAVTNRQVAHGPYAPAYIYGDGTAGGRIADVLARTPLHVQKRIQY